MRFLLWPFTLLYGLVMEIRNHLYTLEWLPSHMFPFPVISVGNITAGGTGKTPHTEYLIALLKNEFRIASLSRGYLRKTKGFIIASESSGPDEIGDEAVQVKQKFPDIIVAVDRNRLHGIRTLMTERTDISAILLDDAFQHRSVTAGLNILLVDYHRPLTSDWLLPAGNLREPVHNKSRAHIIIVTKCPASLTPDDRNIMLARLNPRPEQKVFFSTFTYHEIRPVFPPANEKVTLEHCIREKYSVLLVTGIANPLPLNKMIGNALPSLSALSFPDHHRYRKKDIETIHDAYKKIGNVNKLIITTEKDAVRFRQLTLPKDLQDAMYYIPVKVDLLFGEKEAFDKIILTYVKTNQRDINLSQG